MQTNRCSSLWRSLRRLWPMILGPLLAGCLEFSGSFVEVARVQETRSLPESIKALKLDTRVGGIRVTRAPGQELRIEAVVKARLAPAEVEQVKKGFADHVQVTEEGNLLRFRDAHMDAGDREKWQVELRVAVPRAVAVEAITGVGDVEVDILMGDFLGKSGVGHVRLTAEDAGSIRLDTGTGDVTATVKTVAGDARASSGTGKVSLKLQSVGGCTEADTGTGDVTVAISSSTGKGVKASTGVGNATLRLPAGAKGKFSGSTGVGSVRAQGLPGVDVKKGLTGGSIEGTTGEGPSYEVNSGTGDIAVEAQ